MQLLLFIQFLIGLALGAEKCAVPRIENGRVREKAKFARNIRFNCRKEFQLMGAKYAHCIRGSWDVEIPVCIKPGCRWNRYGDMNGVFIESYRGALIKVDCNPGYVSYHGHTVYCDGVRWNGTFPVCEPVFKEPPKTCEFERKDLCGWTPDPSNKFIKWSLGRGGVLQANHSLFTHQSRGEFMYVDSGSFFHPIETYSVKLYSPVYPTSYLSDVSCFTFGYFMHGAAAGALKVYLLLEEEQLESIVPSFWIEGDQGPQWNKGLFLFQEKINRNFQIVIEVVVKHEGLDVAVDDVSIGECQTETTTTSTATAGVEEPFTDEFDSVDDFTCQNRCGFAAVLISTNITSNDLDESPKCDCHEQCLERDTCCADMAFYCPHIVGSVSDSSTYPITDILLLTTQSSISNVTVTSKPMSTTPTNPTSRNSQNYNPIKDSILASKTSTNSLPNPSSKTTIVPKFKTTTTSSPNNGSPSTSKRPVTAKGKLSGATSLPKQASMTTRLPKQPSTALSPKQKVTKLKDLPPTNNTTTDMPNDVPNESHFHKPEEHNSVFYKSKFSDRSKSNTLAVTSDGVNDGPAKVLHVSIEISSIIELSVAAVAVLLLIASISIFVLRRRRRLSEQYGAAEDSDSILYAMGSSEVLYSTQTSLLGIRSKNGVMSTL